MIGEARHLTVLFSMENDSYFGSASHLCSTKRLLAIKTTRYEKFLVVFCYISCFSDILSFLNI